MTTTTTDYKVADIGLADYGRKEIELAEHEMLIPLSPGDWQHDNPARDDRADHHPFPGDRGGRVVPLTRDFRRRRAVRRGIATDQTQRLDLGGQAGDPGVQRTHCGVESVEGQPPFPEPCRELPGHLTRL